MKSVRFMLVLVLVAVGVMGTAALAQDDEDQPVLGAIDIVEPNLFITEEGAERPVYDLTSFEPGETLRTDETGVALVTWFYDGTESLLGMDANVTLNSFSGTNTTAWDVDLTLNAGLLVSGVGAVAADVGDGGTFVVSTPTFSVQLLRGQMEMMVDEDGVVSLYVTEGRAEVSMEGMDTLTVDANQYYVDGMAEAAAMTDDGVTPNMEGLCTATTNTNLVVRMYASEDSQRLDGVPSGQEFWVRAGSEGFLWLQVYFETDPNQPDLHNFGWIYGPATDFDLEACPGLPHAELAAQLYGGPGIENSEMVDETEPIE